MPKEIVIDINAGGSAVGMNFDEFDMGVLGKKSITRASEILFNDETQLWDIWIPGAFEASVTGFSGYDEARTFEVQWLQECRKQQLDPFSREGNQLARYIIASAAALVLIDNAG